MIESGQGNQITFNGKVTLDRHGNQLKCQQSDDQLKFVQHLPEMRVTEFEEKLNISGLRLFKNTMKIEITGQA